MLKPYLMLGTVVKPQGVRGEVKVRHETGDPERFLDLETVYRKQGEAYLPLRVLDARVNGDDVFITLDGVNDRDAAETLRGTELYIDREHARPLRDNEVYIADMLGLRAVDTQGRLVNSHGLPVVSDGGGSIVVGNGKVTVQPSGEVFSNNQRVGKLRLVSLSDPASAVKEGGNLLSGGNAVADNQSQVRQGMLEASNADTMRTMVEMIQTLRLVEMNQRVIQAQDSTLQQIIDVARK